MKNQKGITLIALIITIIVMLILVAVTLTIVLGDDGIIGKAKTAVSSQQLEQEREILQSEVFGALNYKTMTIDYDKISLPDGWSGSNGTYTSPTGNVFKVDTDGTITENNSDDSESSSEDEAEEELPFNLAEYILGKDLTGRLLFDTNGNGILDPSSFTFKHDDEVDFDETKLTMLQKAFELSESYDSDGNTIYEQIVYCKYDNKNIYKFKLKPLTNKNEYYTAPLEEENTTVKLAYEPDETSRIGKYVHWDFDGDGTVDSDELWIVLYDDSKNGLQIISANTMKYYTDVLYLGSNDTYLTKKGTLQGSTDLEKAIYSYNNAVTTLNSACEEIISNKATGANVVSVRCVGSDPTNKNNESNTYYPKYEAMGASIEDGKYCSTLLKNWLSSQYNGIGKPSDINATTDYDRMLGLDILASENGADYWLASRYVNGYSSYVYFEIRDMDGSGYRGASTIWKVGEYAAEPAQLYNELRPVVTLNSNVTFSGSGTEADPYTF